jgi:ribose/xylose/arabinose/galactoside ABC-type transport system permease subunit
MLALLVIMYCVLRFTKFGRNVYLVGANPSSARAVGINVKLTKFSPFLFSGGFAAIAGILFLSLSRVGYGGYGSDWGFQVLTICLVGGLSFNGGRGTYIGLFLAILIMGSLTNGLTLINMPIFWRYAFEGCVLMFAIILDSLRTRRTQLKLA